MKLKYSARPAGYPVRDIVEIGFQIFRRLSTVSGFAWQEKIHSGDFHTIFNGQFTIQLESKFQLDVPAATPEQIRQQLPTNRP